MKYYMIIILPIIFDLTSGHPLSNLEKQDEPLHPDLARFSDYFRNLMAIPKNTFGMNLSNEHGYVWNDVNEKHINYDVGNDSEGEGALPEYQNSEPNDIFVGIQKKRVTKKDTDLPKSIKTLQNKKNISPIFVNQDQKTPETLKELLNNEQFWTWLSAWVETYMEMLAGHLTKVVKEEVGKQVQFYFNIFESEMDKKLLKPSNLNQESEKNVDKIILDGKEMPLTHTSNIDLRSEITKQVRDEIKLLRRRKDKEENKDKEDVKYKTLRVEAENIYGNSLGNEKVVNVFVFYPKDLNTVLEDIKPITDGVVNGTFTIGPQEHVSINGNQVSTTEKDKDGSELDLDELINEFEEEIAQESKEPKPE